MDEKQHIRSKGRSIKGIYLLAMLSLTIPFTLPFVLIWFSREFTRSLRGVAAGKMPDNWDIHLSWVQYRVIIPGLTLFLITYLMITFGHNIPGMNVDRISFIALTSGYAMFLMMGFNTIYGYLDHSLKGSRVKKWFYMKSEWKTIFRGKLPK